MEDVLTDFQFKKIVQMTLSMVMNAVHREKFGKRDFDHLEKRLDRISIKLTDESINHE